MRLRKTEAADKSMRGSAMVAGCLWWKWFVEEESLA